MNLEDWRRLMREEGWDVEAVLRRLRNAEQAGGGLSSAEVDADGALSLPDEEGGGLAIADEPEDQ